VPASRGRAIQVTTSRGYHAHPAWSPSGTEIAFIRGQTPAGFITNISGSLMIVNLADGREREVTTLPATGTVAWSPDGSRLVAPLRLPSGGSLLHEVNPADGTMVALQPLSASGNAPSSWVDTAWNPKRREIFFATQRG
jgi:Tol biopolymer transport system component